MTPWLETVRRRWLLPVLLLAGGLLISALAARWQAADNVRRTDQALSQAGEQLAAQLLERMQRYEGGLRGVRGAIYAAGIDELTSARFAAYHRSREIDLEYPGARGFGFIRRVPVDRLAAFAAAT